MAGEWKLRIEFRDMFFVVHYRDGSGSVVLLPRAGHSAVLWVDDPKYSYGLCRVQVNFRDSSKRLLWGTSCTRPSGGYLLSANHLFGSSFAVQQGLIDAPAVPSTLNARIVLGGGVRSDGAFSDRAAKNRHARFPWSFRNSVSAPHMLTDRLRFEVSMPPGPADLLLKHPDGMLDTIPMTGRDHELVIWNRDLREIDDEEGDITAGEHELGEYEHLHALIGQSPQVIPYGIYPPGTGGNLGPIGNDEPICGGEEGEPDPPPPPPPPPQP